MWTAAGSSILAEDTLSTVRSALEEGWIGGIHLYYGGGGSGDPVAFSTFGAFHRHVTASKPGDLFIIWSVARLRRQGLLLVDNRFEAPSEIACPLLSRSDLVNVREYLAQEEFNEIFAIKSGESGELEATMTDLAESYEDRFVNFSQKAAESGNAICVLPLTSIDHHEFYLTKAKRPNEKGEVPLGGAY
jgi:hypothetical protein